MVGGEVAAFNSRKEVGTEEVAISIAGQSSFARFIKLPPVEKKRVPEIVQFEAVQQIPFDINEVEWEWQSMDDPDSPDTEVVIFAVKNELINAQMEQCARAHTSWRTPWRIYVMGRASFGGRYTQLLTLCLQQISRMALTAATCLMKMAVSTPWYSIRPTWKASTAA